MCRRSRSGSAGIAHVLSAVVAGLAALGDRDARWFGLWSRPPCVPLRATRPVGGAAGARRRYSLPIGTRRDLVTVRPGNFTHNKQPQPEAVSPVALPRAALERIKDLAQSR